MTFDDEGNPSIRLLIAGGRLSRREGDHEVKLIQGRILVRDNQAVLRHVKVRLGDVMLAVPRATVGLQAPFDVDGSGEVSGGGTRSRPFFRIDCTWR